MLKKHFFTEVTANMGEERVETDTGKIILRQKLNKIYESISHLYK